MNYSKAAVKEDLEDIVDPKLDPLDFDGEVKKYKAFSEKKDVKFDRCDHKRVKFVDGGLLCPCGATWTGTRLQEVFDILTKKK